MVAYFKCKPEAGTEKVRTFISYASQNGLDMFGATLFKYSLL